MQKAIVSFEIKYELTDAGLVIECPNYAARDYIARTLEDDLIVVKVKEATL